MATEGRKFEKLDWQIMQMVAARGATGIDTREIEKSFGVVSDATHEAAAAPGIPVINRIEDLLSAGILYDRSREAGGSFGPIVKLTQLGKEVLADHGVEEFPDAEPAGEARLDLPTEPEEILAMLDDPEVKIATVRALAKAQGITGKLGREEFAEKIREKLVRS